jgi:hypothetical protein
MILIWICSSVTGSGGGSAPIAYDLSVHLVADAIHLKLAILRRQCTSHRLLLVRNIAL